ncbi:hypothetical protein ABZU76_38540 [Amycolatopsis sp. NPDC005232]|uniref:hypothetical protein n=1 Tax=Amycolatopsis sp. NPDC005232 TaxID=3157027 RepID=UPI0033A4F94D
MHNLDTVTGVPPERTSDGDAPDWPRVWDALIDAGTHAGRVAMVLDDERGFFDFKQPFAQPTTYARSGHEGEALPRLRLRVFTQILTAYARRLPSSRAISTFNSI